MAWPIDDLTKDYLDSTSDDPSQARAELEALVDKVKSMLAEVPAGDSVQRTSQKDVPNGYAGLDANGDVQGWNLISSQAANNDSEIVFSSGIDSTYDMYMFIFTNIFATINGGGFYAQISENGGTSYITSGYTFHYNQSSTQTGYSGAWSDTIDHFLPCFAGLGAGSVPVQEGMMIMYSPSSSSKKIFISEGATLQSDDNLRMFKGSAISRNSTGPTNAIRFYTTAGVITSGKIALYGLKK